MLNWCVLLCLKSFGLIPSLNWNYLRDPHSLLSYPTAGLCMGDWLPNALKGLHSGGLQRRGYGGEPAPSLGVAGLHSATVSSILQSHRVIVSTNLPAGVSPLTHSERHPRGATNFKQQGVAKRRTKAPVKVFSPCPRRGHSRWASHCSLASGQPQRARANERESRLMLHTKDGEHNGSTISQRLSIN